jgi:signal recognition particle receptor subunit beta
MVLFNYSTKELTAKVVYYGPGLCGKTTNLQWIHEKLPIKNKGKMLSLATETDRTLFFDFLPIELGSIRGMRTRIQLYTVPGQVFYNATRRMVLKGADCVVFVCDSQEPMLDANLESLENLRQNLEANEIDPDEIPMVLQFNKRDLPNALPVEILAEKLNPRGVPYFEAIALRGRGVEETLKGATTLVFRHLASRYGGAGEGPGPPLGPARPATATVALRPGAGATTEPPRPMPTRSMAAPFPASPPPSPPRAPVASAVRPPAPPPAPPRPAPAPVAAPPAAHPLEELADLNLDEEFDLPEAPPPPPPRPLAPPPAPVPVKADTQPRIPAVEAGRASAGKSTLVREPSKTEALRRRLAQAEPELTLDDFDDEEEIEELTLEGPLHPLPPPAVTPARTASATLPPGARAPGVSTGTITPASTVMPIALEVAGSGGVAEISVPLDISLDPESRHLAVQLRLQISLKVRS